MKLVYETKFSVSECLELLQETKSLSHDFRVTTSGNSFQITRKIHGLEYLSRYQMENPVLDGILIPQSFTTHIEFNLAQSGYFKTEAIIFFSLGIGFLILAALGSIYETMGQVMPTCLACLFGFCFLFGALLRFRRISSITEREAPTVQVFLVNTLQARKVYGGTS